MRHICAVGLQWGDEGKGKIVDVLSESVDTVVRYQGGANAGHTVYIGEKKHVLHHLPTGILREGTKAMLGNGMVLDMKVLLAELDTLPDSAIDRVYVSERAHLVFPHHRTRDKERESQRAHPIGTTQRGIGPTYEDKFARAGLRVGDLAAEGFLADGLEDFLERHGAVEVKETMELCRRFLDRVGHRIVDGTETLYELDARGERFLFEGAQGSLLDIDFGTYPFVTSSSPSFLGVGAGCGFSPRKVDHVLGITKAYCTRVGEGPFPSEAQGEAEERLRELGNEFGTTTSRARRCGWLDLPALRSAVRMNDIDSVAITKTDILTGLESVPVVVDYKIKGQSVASVPFSVELLSQVEPVYEEWPGWSAADEGGLADFVRRVEDAVERPVSILSNGRRRSDVILRSPMAEVFATADR